MSRYKGKIIEVEYLNDVITALKAVRGVSLISLNSTSYDIVVSFEYENSDGFVLFPETFPESLVSINGLTDLRREVLVYLPQYSSFVDLCEEVIPSSSRANYRDVVCKIKGEDVVFENLLVVGEDYMFAETTTLVYPFIPDLSFVAEGLDLKDNTLKYKVYEANFPNRPTVSFHVAKILLPDVYPESSNYLEN